MTLDMARRIVDAALANARAAGSKPVTVVVVDAGGVLVAAAREDGCGLARPKLSETKAQSALALGMSTRQLASFFEINKDLHAVLREATGSLLLPVVGGLLVRDDAETVLGAVGISGGSLQEEESFLLDALASLGLRS